jgi:HlyD family secretion protein
VFNGRVVRIGLESDRVNEERRIHVRCDNCPAAYVLGEQAEVVVTAAVVANGVFVPETMIDGLIHNRGLIWVVRDGRLARHPIEVGHRTLDGRYEVLSGLDGALPIASRTGGLQDGRAARIRSEDDR